MKKLAICKNTTDAFEAHNEIGNTVLIPIQDVGLNPHQPRKQFDGVEIVTLADSIRQHGLLQPISVRYADPDEETNKPYLLIAGERRLRAMKMLSYHEIPCIIVDITPKEAAELAIIENIMRKDLTVFELAESFQLLLTEFDLTQEELGKRLSTSQSNIANKLRLLKFSQNERIFIEEYKLTERHARALLRIANENERLNALLHIGTRNLSVKDTERYIDELLQKNDLPTDEPQTPTNDEWIEKFRKTLEKPLKQIIKRGFSAFSEEIESDDALRIIITIPKTPTEA